MLPCASSRRRRARPPTPRPCRLRPRSRVELPRADAIPRLLAPHRGQRLRGQPWPPRSADASAPSQNRWPPIASVDRSALRADADLHLPSASSHAVRSAPSNSKRRSSNRFNRCQSSTVSAGRAEFMSRAAVRGARQSVTWPAPRAPAGPSSHRACRRRPDTPGRTSTTPQRRRGWTDASTARCRSAPQHFGRLGGPARGEQDSTVGERKVRVVSESLRAGQSLFDRRLRLRDPAEVQPGEGQQGQRTLVADGIRRRLHRDEAAIQEGLRCLLGVRGPSAEALGMAEGGPEPALERASCGRSSGTRRRIPP